DQDDRFEEIPEENNELVIGFVFREVCFLFEDQRNEIYQAQHDPYHGAGEGHFHEEVSEHLQRVGLAGTVVQRDVQLRREYQVVAGHDKGGEQQEVFQRLEQQFHEFPLRD